MGLTIAGVQSLSVNGDMNANLRRAESYVGEAAAQGAKLVLCAEFLAAGYQYEPAIWRSGERRDGPTERWLAEMASKHQIYIGASYLEAEGEDFFNTFTLMRPDGSAAGRVRKMTLPAFEGWFFKPDDVSPSTIDTELGRIGVGICNDNMIASFVRKLHAERPDLVLMPHSAPQVKGLGLVSRVMRESLDNIGPYCAEQLGVPTLMVNKAGEGGRTRMPGIPLMRWQFSFSGPSVICNAEGQVLKRIADKQGVIVAEVQLDPEKKRAAAPRTGSYWSSDPQSFAQVGAMAWKLFDRLGRRAYGSSRARREAARAIAQSQS